jgi:para-nitrobenzyl esterase
MARALAGAEDVFFYEFTDRSAPAPEPLRTLPFPVGASHGLELRYLFDLGGAPALDPVQQALSAQMIDYWAQFVRTGSPAVEGLPPWPGLDGGDQVMSLRSEGGRVVTDFGRTHQCPFWAGLG